MQTKKGLSGTRAPDSSKPLGRVDPASSLTGNILVEDGCVYDVMLNLVDVSKNSDKYFILQVWASCLLHVVPKGYKCSLAGIILHASAAY